MRRLPVIAMAAVLAAAGLATAAWLGPRILDWSHLEPRIRDALGREVSLDGPIRFELLPRPELTIAGVSAIDVSIREAKAVLDAGALLAGRLEIDTLEFSGVELTFDRSLMRPLLPLSVRRIRIEDSAVAFGDTIIPVETATLAVTGPEGPYRLEARAALDGRRYRIGASVGMWQDHMPVAVSIGNGGFEATAVGAVATDPAAGFVFSGRLAAHGEAAPGWEGTFDAEVRIGPDGAEFAGVDAVVEDQHFTGAIRVDWRGSTTIDARLSTALLLFDGWRDRLPQLSGAAPGASLRFTLNAGAVKSGEWTARRVEAAFRRDAGGFAVEKFAASLPGGTQVEITGHGHDSAAFSLETKNLRALLSWLGIDPGAVEETRLRNLQAQGRLRLAGNGISPDALRTRFERADFAFEEVRGRIDGARIEGRFGRRGGRFEAWLTAENLPLDPYLPALARISRQGHGLRDAVGPAGKESRAARCGASGKRIDAPCRPDSTALRVAPRRPPATSWASTVGSATLFGPLLADRTPGGDAGRDPGEKSGQEGRWLIPGVLHLDLTRTRLFGVSAGRLQLAAEMREDGEIVVSRLAVEEAGGFSGEGSGSFGAEAASFRVSGRTTDLDRSANLYGFPLPVVARGLGAVEFEGRGEGPSDMFPIDFRASANGGSLRVSGELVERRRLQGYVELEGPLPPSLQLSDDDGPATLAASVSAERGHADFDDIDFRLGTTRAHGNGSISLNGVRPAARIALAAARVDLPAFSRDVPVWRRRPLETAQFGAFDLHLDLEVEALGIGGEVLDDLRLDLSLAPEAWMVNAASAGWRGGRLAFDGGYLAKDGGARLKLELRDAVLPERAVSAQAVPGRTHSSTSQRMAAARTVWSPRSPARRGSSFQAAG